MSPSKKNNFTIDSDIANNFRYGNDLINMIDRVEISDSSVFYQKYLELLELYISKTKKSIIVYNFTSEKNIIKVDSDSDRSIRNKFFVDYYAFLSKFTFNNNIEYIRILQAPTKNINSKDDNRIDVRIIKSLYKHSFDHVALTLKKGYGQIYFKYGDGWRYNILIIDNSYLIIEQYKNANSGAIEPSQLFVFNKVNNGKNDIIDRYLRVLNIKGRKQIKLSYFKSLVKQFSKGQNDKINEIQELIKEKNMLLEEKESILSEIRTMMTNISSLTSEFEYKKKQNDELSFTIDQNQKIFQSVKESIGNIKTEVSRLENEKVRLLSSIEYLKTEIEKTLYEPA